jgi:feruloyl esterase
MYHCDGGPGPDIFDDLTALEQWVESGTAPTEIIAYKTSSDNDFYPDRGPGDGLDANVLRSRPLCPYPEVARHTGSGSIDNAENFRCIAPE